MRDPNRLDKFYEEFKEIHKKYAPNQRFGQFCSNFFGWVVSKKKKDIFFPEDDKMLEYLKEYVNEDHLLHDSWELEGVTL